MLIELTHAEILSALASHYERRFGVRVDLSASSVGADGRLQLWAKLAAAECGTPADVKEEGGPGGLA